MRPTSRLLEDAFSGFTHLAHKLAGHASMNKVFDNRMLPVQPEGDQTMAKELQEQDDAAAAAELQTALLPTRGRKRPAPHSTGRCKEAAHCLSPEGALACSTHAAHSGTRRGCWPAWQREGCFGEWGSGRRASDVGQV